MSSATVSTPRHHGTAAHRGADLADIDLPPDELLTRLDDLVTRLSAETDADNDDGAESDVGATCLYAGYDPSPASAAWPGRPSAARAGHPGRRRRLVDLPAGPPLGLAGCPSRPRVDVPAGSVLALYTDGLVRAATRHRQRARPAARRMAQPEPSLETTCDACSRPCSRPTRDDVALLVARTHALDGDRVAAWDLPADPALVAGTRERWPRARRLGARRGGVHRRAGRQRTGHQRHPARRAPIELRLIRDRTLICEVSDGSGTAPHLRRARTLDEGGRGLLLVARLTDRWGTRRPRRARPSGPNSIPGSDVRDVLRARGEKRRFRPVMAVGTDLGCRGGDRHDLAGVVDDSAGQKATYLPRRTTRPRPVAALGAPGAGTARAGSS